MSGIWPGDTRCMVMLTFDVDGITSLVRREPAVRERPSTLSMGEYGPTVAVPRILDLLDQFGVPASFFIPSHVAEHHPDMVREVVRRGHEVGAHGHLHEPPPSLSPGEEVHILEKSIHILTGLTGYSPRGFRAPGADLGQGTLDLLLSHGFRYDTSLMGHDAPYWVATAGGERIVEIPFHWELDDFVYFGFAPVANVRQAMIGTDSVLATWKDAFDVLYRFGSAFNLCMHPWIMGRPSRFALLERLIQHMQSKDNVQFSRMDQAAEAWAQLHPNEAALPQGAAV